MILFSSLRFIPLDADVPPLKPTEMNGTNDSHPVHTGSSMHSSEGIFIVVIFFFLFDSDK